MITILYISHEIDRAPMFWYFMSKLKPEYKKQIKQVCCIYTCHINVVPKDLDIEVIQIQGGGYSNKINDFINMVKRNEIETEHFIKINDNCMLPNHALEGMIDHIHKLDEPDAWILSPIISNGLPTFDEFATDFLNEIDREIIYKLLMQYSVPSQPQLVRWGVFSSIQSLNKYTTLTNKWCPQDFYEGVNKLPHRFKDIHPIRYHYDTQVKLQDVLLQPHYVKKWIQQHEYSLKEFIRPYLCNGIYASKTSTFIHYADKLFTINNGN